MAHATVIERRNVINRFTAGNDAVMTGCAIIDHADMGKRRADKRHRTGVTNGTVLGGRQVISRLSDCEHIVMT